MDSIGDIRYAIEAFSPGDANKDAEYLAQFRFSGP